MNLKNLLWLPVSLVLFGCANQGPEPVAEYRPGYLIGYLTSAERMASMPLLPPPPAPGSAGAARDQELNELTLTYQGTPRWDLAAQDSELGFPEAAGHFSCAVAADITEADSPYLYQLLRRVLIDAGRAGYDTKNHYNRSRPFAQNGQPICAPATRDYLSNDGAYPSGHTALGWAWGLVLAEVFPDRAEEAVSRGRSYGVSRQICNVHWASDVEAGRIVGSAIVAQLHSNPVFQRDIKQAKREARQLRAAASMPRRDCEAEAAALASTPVL